MPEVVFHGGSLPLSVRTASEEAVQEADAAIVLGTSLPVYSSYSLVRRMIKDGKPVVVINHGSTRADEFLPSHAKIDAEVGSVLRLALEDNGMYLPSYE